MRMLPASLRRHIRHRALHNLQQSLLHSFPGHIPGDGGIFALPGDLIHLVDIDDPILSPLHVIVRRLDQFQQDILHVLAHIPCLREGGGICNGKGHIDDLRQCLGQISFAAAGGTHHDDIALLEFHIVQIPGRHYPFIMIVDGN